MESIREGYSTQRPPLFEGKFFNYWKNRMEIFIKAENYQVWNVIENGDFEITKMNDKGDLIPKPINEYIDEDWKKLESNAQAKRLLHCGLGTQEYNRIMGCRTAREMWNLLEVTHEGTNEVKQSKIDLLMHQYELFSMSPKENIRSMITQFSNIVNELGALGKIIPTDEQIRKILRSLPHEDWRPKVIALQETKDFKIFTLEELTGSLMTYEMQLLSHNETLKKHNDIQLALKAEKRGKIKNQSQREKGIAQKSEREEEDETESDEDEDLAMLARRFKKFFKKSKGDSTKNRSGRQKPRVDEKCFKCGKSDHKIRDCPFLENESKKEQKEHAREEQKYQRRDFKRAMVAAWSDSESEEEKSDEDAQANLCLMVHSDSETADEPQEEKVRGNNLWYLDSGCSKHMTGDKSRFLSLMPFQGGNVTFGDDKKGEIIGIGKVGKSPSHCIDNVFLVKGLKHNLLSISQFCDKDDDPLLWHRRLGHASLSTLKKLSLLDLVVGLPSIKVKDNQLCEACARGFSK
ncbi:uncharacterized protein LOC133305029 [Gastrolobium bilobum]|uniref:uncharacterized protein LOC133305029 n=1 Tax=Gastrolobium bilobum TaxID=150636 RepID=UPI002AB27282|nr:uncharacterized protein LOC133305029 [Gastrolobium bilobum]